MAIITIEIISDIVCVWCFIGKRTVEKAIGLYQKTYPGGKNDTFTIKWRPCYLKDNPQEASVDKSEVSKIKFKDVSPDKMKAMLNRVHQTGRANGINFNFEGKTGSTRDAHRLIHLSQAEASVEIQDMLVEKLFQAYHEKAMDISDRKVLKDIAVDAGLEEHVIDEWLQSGRATDEVDSEAQQNRDLVTTGVPTFFIQGVHRVDGAQDLQEFFDAFLKVKGKEQNAAR